MAGTGAGAAVEMVGPGSSMAAEAALLPAVVVIGVDTLVVEATGVAFAVAEATQAAAAGEEVYSK